MADLERPLAALVDPPLADPPPMEDLQRRAGRLRHRRWAARSGVAALAVVALLSGVLALAPGREQTVRTAASGGGEGAARGGSQPGGPAALGMDSFEAGGQTWWLRFADGPDRCAEVRSDTTTLGRLCWQGGPLQAASVDVAGTTYLFGLATGRVREVSYGARPDEVVPIWGGTIASSVTGGGAPDDGVMVFGRVMPAGLAAADLVAATADDPRAYTLTVMLHTRVAVVNGVEAPMTASTTVPARTDPTAPPSISPPTTFAPPVTSPPTTVPPIGGSPKRVVVTPGATNLHRQSFESAAPSGAQAVAVRFWSGVEPCSVLGRVDVAEAADKVTITLWTGTGPGAETMACIALAQLYEVIVPMSSPLGSRTVLDGAA